MLALVMCGGKGSRMALPIEKSLLKLRDKTLIEYVLDALIDYREFRKYSCSAKCQHTGNMHFSLCP
jgi:GTP:adenosylcobinamide-phosphate guanylyltransferase